MKTIQPALIIGLGGSGTDIARRFRRRFWATNPNVPFVRCLGIDTAPQNPASDLLPLLPDEEFVWASDFRMDFYTGEGYIQQHPSIRAWWRGYEGLPARFINAGAGMKRPIGRLALFVHYDAIVKRISALLREMFSSNVFFDLPQEYRSSVNIYVVSSTCGGTGTGMFLDLAYIANHIVSEQFNLQPKVRGLLLLPSVFTGTGQVNDAGGDHLRANALGALTELDYAMSKTAHLPPVTYPDGRAISRNSPPFTSCYLVGNQSAAGAVFTDFEDLEERAAVHIQTELASALSNTGAAAMDNVLQAIAVKPEAQGRSRLYSSFNGEWMELPSARVLAKWTKRLALETLGRLGKGTGSADEALRALADSAGYGALRTLFSAPGGNPYMPRVDAFLDVFMDVGKDGKSPDELIQNANTLQTEASRQIAGNTQLPDSIRVALGDVLPDIKAASESLVASRSLGDTKAFLIAVREELSNWIARAQNELGSASSDAWVVEFAQKVNGHKKGLLGSAAQFANLQRQMVIDAAERARESWRLAIRARIANQVLMQMPFILAAVDEMRRAVQETIDLLPAAASRVAREREPEMPATGGGRHVSDEEVEAAYSDAGRPERLASVMSRQLASLVEAPVSEQAIARRVLEGAYKAVHQVAPEYLQTLTIPADEIARRFDQSSPLAVFGAGWSAQPYYKDMDPLWLIGLPQSMAAQVDQVRSKLSAANRLKTQIVLHADEDRVVITAQNHGFPLYALQETSECKRSFDSAPADQRVMCFIQPDAAVRSWDVLPVAPQEAQQLFALAMALGKIRRAGQSYVFRMDGGSDFDIPLSQSPDPVESRQGARDAFLSAGYGSSIKLSLDQRVKKEGNAPLYKELESWLKEQESYQTDAAFPADFKREVQAVRQYLTTIPPY